MNLNVTLSVSQSLVISVVSKEIMFRVFGTPIKSVLSYFQPAASLTEIMKSSGLGHVFTCGRMRKNSATASLKLVSEINHSCSFLIYSVARGMHGVCLRPTL